jgi:cytoplasmic iron level regulating protein YaaA (DUF328/UPF0246 family)
MLSVISPAKTLDLGPQKLTKKHTIPESLDDSQILIDLLSKKTKGQIAKLMSLSDKLAQLNVDRYQAWDREFTPQNSKPALLTFKGDVYQGFDCEKWQAADFTYAQKHLRMLSGLHGVLRPLDLMQPYRLEMGTQLKTPRGKNLYEFWGDAITESLRQAIKASRSKACVNLASNEYFKAVDGDALGVPVITPVFKDAKNGKYKIISFFAKKARGQMANFMVRQRTQTVAELRKFKVNGYRYDKSLSDESSLVFLRDEQ